MSKQSPAQLPLKTLPSVTLRHIQHPRIRWWNRYFGAKLWAITFNFAISVKRWRLVKIEGHRLSRLSAGFKSRGSFLFSFLNKRLADAGRAGGAAAE